jgi:hypothetical protein
VISPVEILMPLPPHRRARTSAAKPHSGTGEKKAASPGGALKKYGNLNTSTPSGLDEYHLIGYRISVDA